MLADPAAVTRPAGSNGLFLLDCYITVCSWKLVCDKAFMQQESQAAGALGHCPCHQSLHAAMTLRLPERWAMVLARFGCSNSFKPSGQDTGHGLRQKFRPGNIHLPCAVGCSVQAVQMGKHMPAEEGSSNHAVALGPPAGIISTPTVSVCSLSRWHCLPGSLAPLKEPL